MTRDSKREVISRKSGGSPNEAVAVKIIWMRGKKSGMTKEFKELSELAGNNVPSSI